MVENNEATQAAHAETDADDEGENIEVKVNDRRRFYPDGTPIFTAEDYRADAAAADARAEEIAAQNAQLEKLSAQIKQLEGAVNDEKQRRAAAETKLAEVQPRLEQKIAQIERETAEMRQRLNKTADEKLQRERAEFVKSMLPLADNLQLAVNAAAQGGTLEQLLDGVRGIISNFENSLTGLGVESIPAVGAAFNPELHEAIDTTEVDEDQDGIITAEYARGYKMGERLLRPARVQVGRA